MDKKYIRNHFTNTAKVWQEKIYKSKDKQGKYEYYDKQYRFDYVVNMIPDTSALDHRALDMGCGAGQLLPVLVKKGYQVYGIDVSQKMIDISQKICNEFEIKADLQLGDCEDLIFSSKSFYLYVAMGVIEYLDDDIPMLQEIERILSPGGVGIITLRNIKSVHVRWRHYYRKYIQYNIMNTLKLILGKKTVRYKIISREHNPEKFKKLLNQFNFEIVDEKYAHFHIFPEPFNRWFSIFEAILGKIMEKKFSNGQLPFMASTYIVKFKRV